jgi:hypothetical protein
MAKIGMRRYDRFGISRDIERQFTELGSLVYNGLSEEQEGILEQPSLRTIFGRIQELELELQQKEQEIETIRTEARDRKAAAAQAGGEQELILKDPALQKGSADSAILMGEGGAAAPDTASRGESAPDAAVEVAETTEDVADDTDTRTS